MLTLRVLGAHSHITSSQCADCPHSAGGCCRAPPRLDWADLGRIVQLGGRDWLLEEVAAGRLQQIPRGLAIRRRKTFLAPGKPRDLACAYLGSSGCSISPERRPATCNYYVCDEALLVGSGAAQAQARKLHESLVSRYILWDACFVQEIDELWPEGPPYDTAFFDWLGRRFRELSEGYQPSS